MKLEQQRFANLYLGIEFQEGFTSNLRLWDLCQILRSMVRVSTSELAFLKLPCGLFRYGFKSLNWMTLLLLRQLVILSLALVIGGLILDGAAPPFTVA